MNPQTERERFEAWCLKGKLYVATYDHPESAYAHGTYCDSRTWVAWLAWQARAALASPQTPPAGWLPFESAPAEGTFLVYMPNERNPIQVAKWHPNVKIIGNVFAFDLTPPTLWHPLPAPPNAEPVSPARCTYPHCIGDEPTDGLCCRAPFTTEMAEAAEQYWRSVGPNAHPLPAQFRWVECYRAMTAAAPQEGKAGS